MSKVKIQGNASGTGVLTLEAPNTNTDRTITLPDGTGTLLTTDGDGSSLTGVGVDGITSASSSGTAINISSANNVGIGTATPVADLDILGAAGSHNGNLKFTEVAGDVSTTRLSIMPYDTDNTTINFDAYLNDAETAWVSSDEGSNFQIKKTGDKLSINSDSGIAVDSNISWDTQLSITSDGRGLSQFTAKAWMRLDHHPSTSVRDSHNVSSASDGGTGIFTMNFTNNMANALYCVQTTSHYGASTNDMSTIAWETEAHLNTSYAKFYNMSQVNNGTSGSLYDSEEAMILIFGD
jgi:hypothetical protein